MIPTKTYPLSAIMGNEVTDKERIAELKAQLPKGMKHCTIVLEECAKGHRTLTATNWVQYECATCKIAELQDSFEDAVTRAEKAENRIAELEAQLADANEMLEKCNSKFIVALDVSRDLEKRLALAVAALESVAADSEERFIIRLANAALKEIEEKK